MNEESKQPMTWEGFGIQKDKTFHRVNSGLNDWFTLTKEDYNTIQSNARAPLLSEIERLRTELKEMTILKNHKDETATIFMNQVKRLQAELVTSATEIERLKEEKRLLEGNFITAGIKQNNQIEYLQEQLRYAIGKLNRK
jgi:tRNA U34 5-carboxymethylaminomethyl modifying GTPase MnmE/TrmE